MREHRHVVAGREKVIHVVETEDDLDGFRDFVREHLSFLGLDSETTGLDIYSEGFRCRTVQFGTPDEAWVIPVEYGERFREDVRIALRAVEGFVLHNASFDLQVIEQTLGIPMEDMWPKVTDTLALSKLVDPRPKDKGGFGHKLEEVVLQFVDPACDIKGLPAKLAHELKTTKEKVWKVPELIHHPEFQLYAGMDPIFAAILLQKLLPLVPAVSKPLIAYEHRISEICSYVDRNGFLLDVDYAQTLSTQMLRDQQVWEAIAFTEYGIDSVNSTEDCAEALEESGVKIAGRTETGKRQVDKALLEGLVENGNELAQIIAETKKLGKWRKTWVQKFLDTRDAHSRCHTSINPLQARTSRMSITGIPAQTLPAGDWTIRRCFLAEEGHVISSVDYQTQELRVLAALSKDPTMIQAFLDNEDLHQITADASGVSRKVGKMANFLTVYGGGAGTLAKNAGIDFPTAKRVLAGFAKTYPGVAKLSSKLSTEAGNTGHIITPTGRRLPVDPQRTYSALNYLIQSSSRDVTCRAIIRLHEAGITPYVRLPIHDEVVLSIPEQHAESGAAEVGRIMAEQMGPVLIGTDPEIGKRSWGSLYMNAEEQAEEARHFDSIRTS